MTKKKPKRDERDPWPEPDSGEFDYINSYYGLNIGRGTPIIYTDPRTNEVKKGLVAWDNRNGLIYICFEGEDQADGPYLPHRFMEYPGE